MLSLAAKENVELSDEEAGKFIKSMNAKGSLSDDELENVTGGTCYGDGWDGTSRAIITHNNSCRLFEPAYKWDHHMI